jgi:CrcB protein
VSDFEFNWLAAVGIVIAGGLGAVLRFYLATMSGKLPWGILLANILGSFLAAYGINFATYDVRLFTNAPLETTIFTIVGAIVITGLAGGLSTFSSFAAGTVELFRSGRVGLGVINVLLNYLLPPLALVLGAFTSASLLK